MITVYHNPKFLEYWETEKINMDKLVAVANVETDSLDEAYLRTNHIDYDWAENPGVEVLTVDSTRSTSVGDVMEMEGQKYVVQSIGFAKLDEDGRPLV